MIDRSYLPFQSAREYQDSKMQKWTGFFLSEHTSALTTDKNKKTVTLSLSLEDKLLLLSQLYSQQLTCRIRTFENNNLKNYEGLVTTINKDSCLIKTASGYDRLELTIIVEIELIEEVENGQT